jgi:hypothetical protein
MVFFMLPLLEDKQWDCHKTGPDSELRENAIDAFQITNSFAAASQFR